MAERYRGQGLASRLIRPLLEEFDKKKLACYLETHNPSNVAIYEHFGFKVVEEGKIPGTDMTHWAMLRG